MNQEKYVKNNNMSSASAVRQKRCLILRRNEENLTVAHLEFHCGSENLCIIKHVFCYTVQKLSALFILICRGMTSSKYPSLCVTTFSASFTNFMVLLPQSLHNRPIRALNSAPNCRKKNADLRAHDWVHSPRLWHQSRLTDVTCAWSWWLCGSDLPIFIYNC